MPDFLFIFIFYYSVHCQIQRLTSANPGIEVRPSPTGVVGAASVPARRRKSTWLETDLDAMITRDRGLDPPESDRRGNLPPVYVNASGYEEEVLWNNLLLMACIMVYMHICVIPL